MTVASTLADWVCSLQFERVAGESVESAKDFLLDHLGVILASESEEASARAAFDYAAALGGVPSVALLGKGRPKVPAESAAFAHATAGHSIEMDDVHNASSIHPGVATIPAALAVAEEFGRSGRDLIAAIVAGYEIILRVGEAAVPTAVYERGFHPTAVCGVFSSAAAAGKLMGLTSEQMTHAFGLAWSFAAGNMSFQAEGSWSKRLQVGNTARAGIQAARLASLGATGPSHVFEAHGFFHGYSGRYEGERLTEGLGEKFKIGEVGVKPFACCRYNQTPVDGLLELRAKHDLDLEAIDRIDRIDIEIASTGLPLVGIPEEVKREPGDTVEAQFSLHYSSAVALVSGAAGREQYREPWLSDRRVRELARKVHAGSSPEIDALFPEKWAARIRVTRRGGPPLDYYSEDCLGDPEKPLGHVGIVKKFEGLTSGVLTAEVRSEVVGLIEGLDQLQDAAQLSAAMLAGRT